MRGGFKGWKAGENQNNGRWVHERPLMQAKANRRANRLGVDLRENKIHLWLCKREGKQTNTS